MQEAFYGRTAAVNSTLLDLYQRDGHRARRVTSGEYAGPCPLCGGDPDRSDRFRIWPNDGKGGHYWCRAGGCEMHRRGDAIEYLKRVKGMSYREACAGLGVAAKRPPLKSISPTQAIPRQQQRQDWEPRGWDAPGEQWRRQAARLLGRCTQQLNDYGNAHIRQWLQASRLLDEESVRSAYLGYCPRELRHDRAKWGLKPEVSEKGQPKQVWIPEGIVIPCYRGGVLHRLRVRRLSRRCPACFEVLAITAAKCRACGRALEPARKYIVIPGGSAVPYLLRTGAGSTVIVESELDAILVNQAAGDLVNTVALGSVSIRPDPELHEHLKRQRSILVALDTGDESLAGAKAAWLWWAERYEHALRCPVVGGKDPADAAKRGLDIRLWIQAALAGGAQRMAR